MEGVNFCFFFDKKQKVLTLPENFFLLKPFFCIVTPKKSTFVPKRGWEGGGGQSLGDMSPKKSIFLIDALPYVSCMNPSCQKWFHDFLLVKKSSFSNKLQE